MHALCTETRNERNHLEHVGVDETNILRNRQCTYNLPIMARSSTHCSTGNVTVLSVCIVELHVTVNNIKMLSVALE
jgi:hypothetical protein